MSSSAIALLFLAVALNPGLADADRSATFPDEPRAGQPMAQWRLPGAVPRPEPGKLLVSRTEMRDPNFAETVVLLIAYDEGGALGLIVNRRSEVALREVLPEVKRLQDREDPVYMGGPVNPNRMFLLVRSKKQPDLARPVVDDVYVSESPELLEKLLKKGKDAEFRAFAGYAGWGGGQLEGELERGDWHVVSGSGERIFSERPDTLWRRLLPRDEMEWSRLVVPAGK